MALRLQHLRCHGGLVFSHLKELKVHCMVRQHLADALFFFFTSLCMRGFLFYMANAKRATARKYLESLFLKDREENERQRD